MLEFCCFLEKLGFYLYTGEEMCNNHESNDFDFHRYYLEDEYEDIKGSYYEEDADALIDDVLLDNNENLYVEFNLTDEQGKKFEPYIYSIYFRRDARRRHYTDGMAEKLTAGDWVEIVPYKVLRERDEHWKKENGGIEYEEIEE